MKRERLSLELNEDKDLLVTVPGLKDAETTRHAGLLVQGVLDLGLIQPQCSTLKPCFTHTLGNLTTHIDNDNNDINLLFLCTENLRQSGNLRTHIDNDNNDDNSLFLCTEKVGVKVE